MKPFYEKLKALRENQDIDLDQIQGRTKINREFLEAIESGNFNVLPRTYIKLFIRAYVTEIGGDPIEALSQLDHFLNQGLEDQKENEPDEIIDEDKDNSVTKSEKSRSTIFSFTNIKLRSKIVKGILLLALWFFIIYVIKQISVDNNGAEGQSRINPTEISIGSIITEENLTNDYVVLSSREELIDSESPYSVKIVTTESLGLHFGQDTLTADNVFLPSGDQKTFSFTSSLDLLLNHSEGVNIFINGTSIPRLIIQSEPVRITFSSNPLRISIKHYTRLE